MSVSKIPFAMKEYLHFSGLQEMKGADALLVDGRKLRHYFDPQPGHPIYHYTSVAGAEGVLESGKIWLSEYSKTNDTSEFVFAKGKFAATIERLKNEYDDRLISRYYEQLQVFEQSENMLIGCFTENRDDLNQWDRYADRASGCVIGFNSYWFWKHKGLLLRRIVYDQRYLDELVEANLAILMHSEEEPAAPDALKRVLAKLFVFEQFCFKDERFVSEAEVRMLRAVRMDETAPNGLVDNLVMTGGKPSRPLAVSFEVKMRNGAYGPTRYIELPYRYKTWSALRSIGFGPKCSDTDERRIREKFGRLKGVRFWRSDLPLR